MTLVLDTLNAPQNNVFQPKVGCGLVYCLSENDYVLQPGTQSYLPLVFDFYANISPGDTMLLHGFNFTFVSGVPTNLNEIQINTGFTAANVLAVLDQIPFFSDNYTITQPSQWVLIIENNLQKFDADFNFNQNTLNPGAIDIVPVLISLVTAGSNPIFKSDYVVQIDFYDVTGGEVKLCNTSFFKHMSVQQDGSARVCFDVQKVIEDSGLVRTSLPAPFPVGGVGVIWNGIDPDFTRDFRFRFTGSYSQSNTGCARVIAASIRYPFPLGLRLKVVNIIEDVDSEYSVQDFSYFGNTFPIRTITIHPEDYIFCQDTEFEFRVDFPVAFIQSLPSGIALLVVTYNYTDGTAASVNYNFNSAYNGIQVVRLKLGATIPAPNPTKVLDFIEVRVAQSAFGNPLQTVAKKDYYFNSKTSKRCCGCLKQFYFLSDVGNNESILSRCDLEQEFESLPIEYAKDVACAGFNFEDSAVFDGGVVAINAESMSKTHKVLFECNIPEYLEAFLKSSVKFYYDSAARKLYRIRPAENKYKIFQAGENRFLMEFSYRKSIDAFKRTHAF